MSDVANTVLWTIGHSTRSSEEFIQLLVEVDVNLLIDVRTIPRSRHNPQFNADRLPDALGAAAIDYRHEKKLGGLRKPRAESPNMGWRNTSFRGYADHMQSGDFIEAVDDLLKSVNERRCAVMCAEAVPWRCHRSLIGDALTLRDIEVRHIMASGKTTSHRMTPFAHVDGLNITYPGTTPTVSEPS